MNEEKRKPLVEHREEIFALGEHHPPTGRIEALNNNWETLVGAVPAATATTSTSSSNFAS
jgi:hypothetical protein